MECDHPLSLIHILLLFNIVCVCTCMHAHEWTYMPVCGGHRLTLSVIQELFTVFSHWNLESLINVGCLSGLGAPGVPPVFPLQG